MNVKNRSFAQPDHRGTQSWTRCDAKTNPFPFPFYRFFRKPISVSDAFVFKPCKIASQKLRNAHLSYHHTHTIQIVFKVENDTHRCKFCANNSFSFLLLMASAQSTVKTDFRSWICPFIVFHRSRRLLILLALPNCHPNCPEATVYL